MTHLNSQVFSFNFVCFRQGKSAENKRLLWGENAVSTPTMKTLHVCCSGTAPTSHFAVMLVLCLPAFLSFLVTTCFFLLSVPPRCLGTSLLVAAALAPALAEASHCWCAPHHSTRCRTLWWAAASYPTAPRLFSQRTFSATLTLTSSQSSWHPSTSVCIVVWSNALPLVCLKSVKCSVYGDWDCCWY